MFPCLPLYDRFYCHTRAAVPFLRQAGCPGAAYLALAADPDLHRPEPLTAEDERAFGCDVVFVGNHRPEHAALLGALEGLDLAIWGPETWKRAASAWVRSRWRGRPLLTGREYAKANRAAKVALCPIDPLDRPGHNMRCFELPACKAFALVQRTEEVLEVFTEGESVVTFDGARELADQARRWLGRPEERRRIAEAAYERVVHGGHTYRDRAREVLRDVDLGALAR
jgi:spore maturation protein CgeB